MSAQLADACIRIATGFRLTAAGMRRGTRYENLSPKTWDAYAEFLETLSARIRDLERSAPQQTERRDLK